MLLASILCTGAAGRRRSSSPRPGSIHRPNFGSRHRPTLPSLIRTVSTTTFKPNRRFRPTSNRFNFNSIPPNPSDLTQREGENKISCRNAHEVLPDYKNPSYYKICIPIGRNWILYTYRCPTGSEFHPENLKCTKISTTTNTATTTVPTTISVDEITESAISNNGIDVGFHLNATETIDVLPEMSMETWDSSSSSEEEISTNSPTSTTAQTVPTPRAPASVEAKPLSQFVQSLFSQGSNQEMSDRFSILTKYLMTTVKPQQMSGHQNKISTDFMHETTSNIPLTTR